MTRAALGLAVHTGWAHAVAVALAEGGLVVLHKERLALFERPAGASEEAFFYHRAAELPVDAAARVIAADERVARQVTARSLRRLSDVLAKGGHRLVAARVVDKKRRPLPPLEAILASHPLLHAAEGALFRRVVVAEAGKLVGDAAEIDGANLAALTAKATRSSAPAVAASLARAGKAAGAPWSKEHKECALAAWSALLTS